MLKSLLVSAGLSLITLPLQAQAHDTWIRGPAPSVLFTDPTTVGPTVATDTTERDIRPTHWQRGLLIGGGIGAVGLGGFTYALCEGFSESQENCLGPALGGAAVGAVVGGVIGALIGGQVPKEADTPPADSTSTAP
jgi:hypothetical protein